MLPLYNIFNNLQTIIPYFISGFYHSNSQTLNELVDSDSRKKNPKKFVQWLLKKFFGTENEYQNFHVEKKIFLSRFFYFLWLKKFFFLQAFINEAHQRKLPFQD